MYYFVEKRARWNTRYRSFNSDLLEKCISELKEIVKQNKERGYDYVVKEIKKYAQKVEDINGSSVSIEIKEETKEDPNYFVLTIYHDDLVYDSRTGAISYSRGVDIIDFYLVKKYEAKIIRVLDEFIKTIKNRGKYIVIFGYDEYDEYDEYELECINDYYKKNERRRVILTEKLRKKTGFFQQYNLQKAFRVSGKKLKELLREIINKVEKLDDELIGYADGFERGLRGSIAAFPSWVGHYANAVIKNNKLFYECTHPKSTIADGYHTNWGGFVIIRENKQT